YLRATVRQAASLSGAPKQLAQGFSLSTELAINRWKNFSAESKLNTLPTQFGRLQNEDCPYRDSRPDLPGGRGSVLASEGRPRHPRHQGLYRQASGSRARRRVRRSAKGAVG